MTESDTLAPLRVATAPSRHDVAQLRFHPEREKLFNELHTRPFPVLETGSHIEKDGALDELRGLVSTAGADVVGELVQKTNQPSA
ncbi:MAG: hypothetical protein ACOY7J_23730, partial [Pseudomonadota bacterium]